MHLPRIIITDWRVNMRRFIVVLILSLTFVLAGCDTIDTVLGLDIEDVRLDESTLEPYYQLDDFDIGTIKLIVDRVDGTQEIRPLTLTMFSREDRTKLSANGIHTVTARFRGFEVEFEIRISSRTVF